MTERHLTLAEVADRLQFTERRLRTNVGTALFALRARSKKAGQVAPAGPLSAAARS